VDNSTNSAASFKSGNIVRARVKVRGTRPLLQHAFGPDAIPLEKGEKTGVAGNDPSEWRKTCMVTKEGHLYIRGTYVFSTLRAASVHTKKGRGSIQSLVAATLQIEETVVLLNRRVPEIGDPPTMDLTAPVYIDVCGVRNPTTKARNVRYRLACSPGWECEFTILWDRTIVAREQMKAVIRDASILVGFADGRSVGNGRFEVISYTELDGAEETPAEGSVGETPADSVASRRKAVRQVLETAVDNGMPH
jgi:hypothetical protein